uniref:Syntaxin N-terminal domain-containing protein n=1 Tax=Anopheles epiroticus TaxID=199890 RepID=A0A182P9G7_9DIPT
MLAMHHMTPVEVTQISNLHTLILEINSEVALFRDLLIHVGQSRDCPELREKIRKLRRSCVEACKHTAALILPQIRTNNSTSNKNFINRDRSCIADVGLPFYFLAA